jgi:UDP-N-acetyl-2-amino-2-deoxyglucuronate dehydrogenase
VSSPYAVALVGCGRASKDHVRALRYYEKRGRLRLEGIVDRDRAAVERVVATGRHADSPLCADDLRDLLTQRAFDLVVIATPPATHHALASAAMDAGAHVIVEKPMTLNMADARDLCERAAAQGRTLAVGLKYRYIFGVDELRRWIQSGRFGPPLYGTAAVRWGHDQAYYDRAPWLGTWTGEGGALLNQTIHAIDLMTWLMDAEPIAATAVLARQAHEMDAADLSLGVLTLKGNRYLQVEGTTNTDPDRHEAAFFLRLEHGTVRASILNGALDVQITDDDGRRHERALAWATLKRHIRHLGIGALRHLSNPYTFLYDDVMDAIERGRDPIAPCAAGVTSLDHTLALVRAGREGRTVTWPMDDVDLMTMGDMWHVPNHV